MYLKNKRTTLSFKFLNIYEDFGIYTIAVPSLNSTNWINPCKHVNVNFLFPQNG